MASFRCQSRIHGCVPRAGDAFRATWLQERRAAFTWSTRALRPVRGPPPATDGVEAPLKTCYE